MTAVASWQENGQQIYAKDSRQEGKSCKVRPSALSACCELPWVGFEFKGDREHNCISSDINGIELGCV
mgnify:CR=1 FL=1